MTLRPITFTIRMPNLFLKTMTLYRGLTLHPWTLQAQCTVHSGASPQSLVMFCKVFFTCSTAHWADTAAIVQPNW